MKFYITKRDGSLVFFDGNRINIAIAKANFETKEMTDDQVRKVAARVSDIALYKLQSLEEEITVEDIQDEVERALIKFNFLKTAKAYILYREKRKEERQRDLFKPRLALKPREYPDLYEYTDAIRHSYWIHTEFNYTSDIQDFKVNVTEAERNAIKNAMLAISQVEVDVKTFWGNLFSRLPKPELAAVGYTFAESEVRHSDAYSHLLEILGLNEEFENIINIPELMQRITYLKRSNKLAQIGEDKDFVLAILLFSLFIEHISLFSQFLVIMSFNKHKNLFKGISNAVEATSKEEELHGQFGIDLINTFRQERPEWFDQEMEAAVYSAAMEALDSEKIVIDWIYEAGDLDFMPKYDTLEFIKDRLNNSLESIGYERIFEVDEKSLDRTSWMDDEILSTKHVDFFKKRSINYTKRSRSMTGDDLF